jgi:hypothetical protein
MDGLLFERSSAKNYRSVFDYEARLGFAPKWKPASGSSFFSGRSAKKFNSPNQSPALPHP